MAVEKAFTELYEIQIQNHSTLYLTNYVQNLTISGTTYKKAIIERDEVSFSRELEECKTNVQIKVTSDISDLLNVYDIPNIFCRIKGYVLEDSTIFDIFAGYVQEISFSNSYISLSLSPFSASIKKEIPHWRYQATCNNNLFDSNCGLSRAVYTVTGSIDAVNSDVEFQIGAASGYSANYFFQGILEVNGEKRMIVYHNGNNIRIHFPFSETPNAGTSCTLLPGCDRRCTTCQNKFSNFDNFSGFPTIPSRNPSVYGIS